MTEAQLIELGIKNPEDCLSIIQAFKNCYKLNFEDTVESSASNFINELPKKDIPLPLAPSESPDSALSYTECVVCMDLQVCFSFQDVI